MPILLRSCWLVGWVGTTSIYDDGWIVGFKTRTNKTIKNNNDQDQGALLTLQATYIIVELLYHIIEDLIEQ
jgi:hypothetical protein